MEKPVIVSMGDPVGVGPELLIKALISGELQAAAPALLVAGDVGVLVRAARIFGRTAVLTPGRGLATHQLEIEGNILPVRALSELPATSLSFGQPTPACGRAMLDYIEWSCDQVLCPGAGSRLPSQIGGGLCQGSGQLCGKWAGGRRRSGRLWPRGTVPGL